MPNTAFLLLTACWAPVPREALPDQYASGFFGVYLAADGGSVQVSELVKDGPAERAGLLIGDQLVKVDTFEVDGTETLREMIASLRPGAKIPLTIKRNGATLKLTIRVMAKP